MLVKESERCFVHDVAHFQRDVEAIVEIRE